MVTLDNGQTVQALTPERLVAIVNGMIAKGKVLTVGDDGRYLKGLSIQGNGNPFEGPIGLRFIYNVDVVSHVAMGSPKALEAEKAISVAMEHGDVLEIHNACRAYLNAVTISFNEASRKFENGQLISARVRVVTTDNGTLISLEKAVAQAAEVLVARPELKHKFSFMNRADAELPENTVEATSPANVLA